MEYLTGAAASAQLDTFKGVIDDSEILSKTRTSLVHQAAHTSAGSIIGGLVGGPFGAMIGGIAGALIGFVTVSRYRTIFFVLADLSTEERRDVMHKFQSLLTLNVRSVVTRSVTSVRDSVTTFVSEKSQAVTGTVTESVVSVKGSVVSATESVIAAPGNVASYMYQSTRSVTSATTNAVTEVVTQNFMTRYIKRLANGHADVDMSAYVTQKEGVTIQ